MINIWNFYFYYSRKYIEHFSCNIYSLDLFSLNAKIYRHRNNVQQCNHFPDCRNNLSKLIFSKALGILHNKKELLPLHIVILRLFFLLLFSPPHTESHVVFVLSYYKWFVSYCFQNFTGHIPSDVFLTWKPPLDRHPPLFILKKNIFSWSRVVHVCMLSTP